MGKCKICGKFSTQISQTLMVCKDCIRYQWSKAEKFVFNAFETPREKLKLPTFPPKSGVTCKDCGNECKIMENEKGYCGLVINEGGKLKRLFGKNRGLISYYYDDHPTNCTSGWCCGSTGIGYPKYSIVPHREIGFMNLSIFAGSCSYFCQYCQNWSSWHEMLFTGRPSISVEELCRAVNERITCACIFGGCASCQPEFTFKFMKSVKKTKEKLGLKVFRICLESNGNFSWYWLRKIAKLSLESGGGIKIDLKTSQGSKLNIALSGVHNEISYKNFEKLVVYHQKRPEVPFLRASTLLVPHYIDLEEINKIARFISELDPTIPYSLLAYYPHYNMNDIGFTSKKFAQKCLEICRNYGLKRVRIGNIHLLV